MSQHILVLLAYKADLETMDCLDTRVNEGKMGSLVLEDFLEFLEWRVREA
jgi:hypothetical protein